VGGCISGDVLDVRTGALHTTAEGHVPLLIASMSVGGAFDRQIRLPLSMRRELMMAPLDRSAFQWSIAFVDLELADKTTGDTLRLLVMPVMVEGERTRQETGSRTLDRQTQRFDVDMLRFVVRDRSGGTGELGFFNVTGETNTTLEEQGADFPEITRISIASLAVDRERYGIALDGGMLTIGGTATAPCENVRCVRGFYVGAFRWSWPSVSVEGRAERAGFLAENDLPAYEDRGTATLAMHRKTHSLTMSSFAARSRSWLGGPWIRSAGTHVSLSQSLRHGMSALVDGEVVRADGDLVDPDAGSSTAARAMVSLAWQRKLIKY
jgi:hypothetical protein